ncbi:MAG TPA: ABC transporter permease [Gaiellaceae bacterium]|nr:ABC transporter permease [Gaiellaceae bacterium]
MLPEEREEIHLSSGSVGRPAAAGMATGAVATHEDPMQVASTEMELTYETGVELEARSQWAYARMRFFRHKLAVTSVIILIGFGLVAIFASQIAPYGEDEIPLYDVDYLSTLNRSPTFDGWHIFGTDQVGRDNLSRVIYGIQTSLGVALVVALLSTLIGTVIGAVAGYYGGAIDNGLMRFTDLILTVPGLAVLLVAAAYLGQGSVKVPLGVTSYRLPQPMVIGLILAFLFWTGIARIVRGLFLSLREKEFVEAAKASGAGDRRIILRHILPNCVGPIVVNTTLIIAAAILVEAALSFLGFGIQPPASSIGTLIAAGQQQGIETWWLVTFPGLVIVIIALCINFVGDGLRDALDPTQRVRA